VAEADGSDRFGVLCPKCFGFDTGIVSSGLTRKGFRRRRRDCHSCGARWSTLELPVADLEAFQRVFRDIERLVPQLEAALTHAAEIKALLGPYFSAARAFHEPAEKPRDDGAVRPRLTPGGRVANGRYRSV
jgi:hypothetical protein